MRYLVLVILNLPIIFLAFLNIITQYKLHHITTNRFRHQLMLWLVILTVLISSFPVYNQLSGKPLLDSSALSLFDIVQTTAIIYMVYVMNNHRRKLEQDEKRLRDLHQELSIRLSQDEKKT